MSLAISEPSGTKFLTRFEHVCASLRTFQIGLGLSWTLLAAVLGFTSLAVADFLLELPWVMRLAGLSTCGIVTLAALGFKVVAPLRWWTKPRTAIEIEKRFPQLGQRVRTVIQYAGLSHDLLNTEGAAPSLVEALERETDIQVEPLPLNRIVPWRRAWVIAAVAAAPLLFLLVAAGGSRQWRLAIERALLGRRPYTTISVLPQNVLVDHGGSVPLAVELHGRLKRDVVLYTRAVGEPDGAWKGTKLDSPDRGPAWKRVGKLDKVEKPLDYRVEAGSSSSPVYRIDVRYPLVLNAFEVSVVPPAYTGVQATTVKGGDLRVIEGSEATFQITFDATPVEASLVFSDPAVRAKKDKSPPPPQVIPLKSNGASYTGRLKLVSGLEYQIEARTADGRLLPKNRYKIEVSEDRPPRIAFERPEEAVEVHPVAEVLNRIRVADDFGLSKAGIVFQFNNGDEQTLIVKDFQAGDAQTRTTSAALEESLLLEKLAASPTDSLVYYAFAEDNHPAGARRTETELRYIDIRPFKRIYKLGESGDDAAEGEGELASLSELIARQRFNLNRATRLVKHKPADKTYADDPLKIAGFEETLVELTREFTRGIEGIVGERIEPLHAAEESMLAAVGALDHGQNERAPDHMGSALRHLVSARNTLRITIGMASASARQAIRGYDRLQRQKIRRPKKDREQAEEIAEQIEQAAEDEDFVYATMGAILAEQERGEVGTAKEGEETEPKNNKRREATERQEQIVDKLAELEDRLKKLETSSDLARVRMADASGTAQKAKAALARGDTSGASESAKAAAAKLHELARQVKGELALEVAAELAMARDLADEMAQHEGEFGEMPDEAPASGAGSSHGQDKGASGNAGSGKGGRGGWRALTAAEQLERLEEAAKTLEQWLKDASLSAEGDPADRIRALIEESDATRVVESARRIGELHRAGQKTEARRDAKKLSQSLETLARQLDSLYRAIIAPELASILDIDKRVTELLEDLKNAPPGEKVDDWRRRAEALIRDLEKAGFTEAAKALADTLAAAGNGVDHSHGPLLTTLTSASVMLRSKIQELLLKDMISSRDEPTPPAFKELVERYYEVLSKTGNRK
jgi:hypothetical protein